MRGLKKNSMGRGRRNNDNLGCSRNSFVNEGHLLKPEFMAPKWNKLGEGLIK
jgi:hypothetical protein